VSGLELTVTERNIGASGLSWMPRCSVQRLFLLISRQKQSSRVGRPRDRNARDGIVPQQPAGRFLLASDGARALSQSRKGIAKIHGGRRAHGRLTSLTSHPRR
jgi:hypothetical protein